MGAVWSWTRQRTWILVVRTLLDAGVRFLIVGGWAREFYGHEHQAGDLDLFVEFSAENCSKLRMALQQFHVGAPSYEELSPRSNLVRIRDLNPDAGLLTGIKGVAFDEAWSEGVETTFDGDLPVRILSAAHVGLSGTRPPLHVLPGGWRTQRLGHAAEKR